MNRRGFFSLLAGIAGAIGIGKVPWVGPRRSPVKSPPVLYGEFWYDQKRERISRDGVLWYDLKDVQLTAPTTFKITRIGGN